MNRFDLIAWDADDDEDGNIAHIAEHGVTVEEFEEVLESPDATDDFSASSGLPARFGWTTTGRHLMVVYVIEQEDGYRIAYPVTAYEVPPRS